MGAWGYEPYANDTAADWFANTMDSNTPLPVAIGTALESSYESEIRAAAFLLEKIAYGYIYPNKLREPHIETAIGKLQKMLESEWVDSLRVRLSRDDENVLMSRIRKDQGQPSTSVYDALDWAMGQLQERYAGHAESDTPPEYQIAKAVLEENGRFVTPTRPEDPNRKQP